MATKREIAAEIKKLKESCDQKIPARKIDKNLVIATWNIQKFGASKEKRAISYMAEICKHADIVAIQEVQANLKGLETLQSLLPPTYKVIFSDETEGHERLCYLYDTRSVTMTGLASDIVLQRKRIVGPPKLQFYRTPYAVSFRSGYFDFILATVHSRRDPKVG